MRTSFGKRTSKNARSGGSMKSSLGKPQKRVPGLPVRQASPVKRQDKPDLKVRKAVRSR